MFLEYNSIIIDPLCRYLDVSALKEIPGMSVGKWEEHKDGYLEISVSGLVMFNPWLAEFCINNELLNSDKKPFEKILKKIQTLELIILGQVLENASEEQKYIFKRFVTREKDTLSDNLRPRVRPPSPLSDFKKTD